MLLSNLYNSTILLSTKDDNLQSCPKRKSFVFLKKSLLKIHFQEYKSMQKGRVRKQNKKTLKMLTLTID